MDDFSVSSLSESKNEWCARLLNILTPTIAQGLKSIFDEAWKLCQDNKEQDKYLMTFQNFLTRVPKWNQTIIDTEKTRIIETSGCRLYHASRHWGKCLIINQNLQIIGQSSLSRARLRSQLNAIHGSIT